jgi:hypothetical protein
MHACVFCTQPIEVERTEDFHWCFDLSWKILVFGWSLPSVPCFYYVTKWDTKYWPSTHVVDIVTFPTIWMIRLASRAVSPSTEIKLWCYIPGVERNVL